MADGNSSLQDDELYLPRSKKFSHILFLSNLEQLFTRHVEAVAILNTLVLFSVHYYLSI